MKRFLTIILPLLLLAGCATTPTAPTLPSVDTWPVIAKHAAYTGTALYLLQHPEQEAKFVKVHDGLVLLSKTNAPTATDLTALIKQLPIDQLKLESPEGRIIVGEALMLYDDVFKQTMPVNKPELVTKTADAIAQGIDLALAMNAAVNSSK